jgi:pimeloyl-ACP methyl ester carboxylesterase
VLVPGFVSHLDLSWEEPTRATAMHRLGEFARVIVFDKRNTGLSDRTAVTPTLEERMDDIRAVMDAVGSERALLFAVRDGGLVSVVFAASHPDRTLGLVLWNPQPRQTSSEDYPWGWTTAQVRRSAAWP